MGMSDSHLNLSGDTAAAAGSQALTPRLGDALECGNVWGQVWEPHCS